MSVNVSFLFFSVLEVQILIFSEIALLMLLGMQNRDSNPYLRLRTVPMSRARSQLRVFPPLVILALAPFIRGARCPAVPPRKLGFSGLIDETVLPTSRIGTAVAGFTFASGAGTGVMSGHCVATL